MDAIELKNCTIRKKECIKVFWKNIPAGLTFCDGSNHWRITTDLKGEFWAFDEFPTKELAIEELIRKLRSLNEYRVNLLQSNSAN